MVERPGLALVLCGFCGFCASATHCQRATSDLVLSADIDVADHQISNPKRRHLYLLGQPRRFFAWQ